ncbi:MAG: FAD-dependent oxidoreductase [Polyangia bacterium]
MTSDLDVVIVGAGISGLACASYAARAGLHCAVLEQAAEPGGCIHTVRTSQGFWFELGAHTLYNSYGALLEILDRLGARACVQTRRKLPFRLWVGGKARSLASEVALGELLASAWRILGARKAGRTVAEYYGALVGARNWQRVFSPLLAAVPSQRADDFPAEMLFKRRPRRKDFPRTFTLAGGLTTLVERLSRQENVCLRTRAAVAELGQAGSRFVIATEDGARLTSRSLVIATPPAAAARLLDRLRPDLSRVLARIATTEVVSTGVVLAQGQGGLPAMLGLAPLADDFLSLVTRDVVADEQRRGLAFHFRPGLTRDQRLAVIARVSGAEPASFLHVAEHTAVLPSPGRHHPEIVAALDDLLRIPGIYLAGNFFGGLSLEDCVIRARAESDRLLRDLSARSNR